MAQNKKKTRIDVSSSPAPLTDKPFASLRADGLPAADLPAAAASPPAFRSHPYRVAKTAKGGYHLSVEKRAAGKVVTLLHRVEDDGNALARELKKHCGVGGTYADGIVELQGDVREKVETLLKKWMA